MARSRRRANKTGRSDGDEQFIPIGYPMARSAAWRSLSGPAVKVWVELRSRYNGGNNGKLSLSLDEGARLLGLGKATVNRALKELQAKGFIVLRHRGTWYGRKASEFSVTDRSHQGTPPTYAWRSWRPSVERPPVPERIRNSFLGSEADHIETATGPLQNRRAGT